MIGHSVVRAKIIRGGRASLTCVCKSRLKRIVHIITQHTTELTNGEGK